MTKRSATTDSLGRVAATLAAFPTKVFRMRALDAEAMDGMSGDVARELSRVGNDVKALEATIPEGFSTALIATHTYARHTFGFFRRPGMATSNSHRE